MSKPEKELLQAFGIDEEMEARLDLMIAYAREKGVDPDADYNKALVIGGETIGWVIEPLTEIFVILCTEEEGQRIAHNIVDQILDHGEWTDRTLTAAEYVTPADDHDRDICQQWAQEHMTYHDKMLTGEYISPADERDHEDCEKFFRESVKEVLKRRREEREAQAHKDDVAQS